MACSRSAARADYIKLRLFWTATGHYNKLNLGIALTGAVLRAFIAARPRLSGVGRAGRMAARAAAPSGKV